MKFIIEPIHDLRKEIAQTSYLLIFYANKLSQEVEDTNKIKRKFRENACRLLQLSYTPVAYNKLYWLFGMPSKKEIQKTIPEIIGLSNTIGETTPYDPKSERYRLIKNNLKLPLYDKE